MNHPNLCPQLDAELSQSDLPHVVAAWASQPVRTRDELTQLLDTEKRVTVLTELAKNRGLPDDAYRRIAERANLKVAVALLDNSSVPDDAVVTAAKAFVARPLSRGLSDHKRATTLKPLTAALVERPQIGAEIEPLIEQTQLLYLVGACPYLSRRRYELRLDETLAALESATARFTAAWTPSTPYPQRNSLHHPVDDALRALFELGASPLATAEDHRRILNGWDRHQDIVADVTGHGTAGRSDRAKRLRGRADQGEWVSEVYLPATPARTAVFAAETEEDLLAAASIAAGAKDLVALRAAALHTQTTPAVLARMGDHLRWGLAATVLDARAGDLDLVVEVMARCPAVFSDQALARTRAPEQVLARLLHRFGEVSDKNLPKKFLASRYFTRDVLLEAPTAVLAESRLPGPVRYMVSQLLIERLGDTDEGWAELESLLFDFTGPVHQLFDTVELLRSAA